MRFYDLLQSWSMGEQPTKHRESSGYGYDECFCSPCWLTVMDRSTVVGIED